MPDDVFSPQQREIQAQRQIGRQFAEGKLVAYVTRHTYDTMFSVQARRSGITPPGYVGEQGVQPVTLCNITFMVPDDLPKDADPANIITAEFSGLLAELLTKENCHHPNRISTILTAAAKARPSFGV